LRSLSLRIQTLLIVDKTTGKFAICVEFRAGDYREL
jgi:hypothetical protein